MQEARWRSCVGWCTKLGGLCLSLLWHAQNQTCLENRLETPKACWKSPTWGGVWKTCESECVFFFRNMFPHVCLKKSMDKVSWSGLARVMNLDRYWNSKHNRFGLGLASQLFAHYNYHWNPGCVVIYIYMLYTCLSQEPPSRNKGLINPMFLDIFLMRVLFFSGLGGQVGVPKQETACFDDDC